jgi:hypothetical protein
MFLACALRARRTSTSLGRVWLNEQSGQSQLGARSLTQASARWIQFYSRVSLTRIALFLASPVTRKVLPQSHSVRQVWPHAK